jgi:hypothetical protein
LYFLEISHSIKYSTPLASRLVKKTPPAKKAKKKPVVADKDDDEEKEEEEKVMDDETEDGAGDHGLSDGEPEGPIPLALFKGRWAVLKQKMILARLPRQAQPVVDIGLAKSYTLDVGKSAKIQVILSKPLFYVKGADLAKVQELSKAFNVKFTADKSGGVGVACKGDPVGAFAQAMSLAQWKFEDFDAS